MMNSNREACRNKQLHDLANRLADHVDHVQSFQGRDEPPRLDPGNLQSLCRSCHAARTAAGQRRGGGSIPTGATA